MKLSKYKKGDKVFTRDGQIETVIKVNSNGNIETEENDYSWTPESLTPLNKTLKIDLEGMIYTSRRRKIEGFFEEVFFEAEIVRFFDEDDAIGEVTIQIDAYAGETSILMKELAKIACRLI